MTSVTRALNAALRKKLDRKGARESALLAASRVAGKNNCEIPAEVLKAIDEKLAALFPKAK
jgi:hypothetical protein